MFTLQTRLYDWWQVKKKIKQQVNEKVKEGKQLRRRTGWLENGGKWREENACLEEYVACWKNKLWNCLDMVGMCITYYTMAHSWRLVNFYGAYSWLKTIWLPHISPCTSFFCQSISGFFPSVSPNCYSLVLSHSLLSFTLLQIKEVVCVQTNTGWKTVVHTGKGETWAPLH